MFDNGVRLDCDRILSYMQQLGLTHIDYHIASHYHDDHIGCTVPVLQEFPLRKQAYDRGGGYNTVTFRQYTNAVGALRKTADEGGVLILDKNTENPVRIEFAALNGNGVITRNENDLSLVCVVRWGQFDAVIGGDLSGYNDGGYKDIESAVAKAVGQVEVYKVNHHGSKHSSNTNWLHILHPQVGIISCGNGNTHGHPTDDCVKRLRDARIHTYWTETGNGAKPELRYEKVGGNIIVETTVNATNFTVTYSGNKIDSYPIWNAIGILVNQKSFAWSEKSGIYHFSDCSYVKNISPGNLVTNSVKPSGKVLHAGCPKINL